jgi:predicted PurR-regulated permease PerM
MRSAAKDVNVVLSRYVRGLLFLVALMSAVTWAGLTFVFHLPFALPIAIATGLLEVIPFVGPIAAGALAAVVAFSHGGVGLTVGVAVFYFVLRQAEDQLVMPAVIGRAVALHPAVIIFAVLAGGTIGGVLGTLLAIPTAAALKVLLDHWVAASRGDHPVGS